jgi:hypothetical protein
MISLISFHSSGCQTVCQHSFGEPIATDMLARKDRRPRRTGAWRFAGCSSDDLAAAALNEHGL